MVRESLAVGLDVGSTTCKAIVVDPASRRILWSRYERHHARQGEKVLDLLQGLAAAFPPTGVGRFRLFVTGSGAAPLAEPLAASFVQETNALALAAESLHPDVGSVIELGGQDAKFVLFKHDPRTGARSTLTSMNDRCASGTGVTIDRCLQKLGMSTEQATQLDRDEKSRHQVAAKWGVFAETDVVNLSRSGVAADEIVGALGDAIVLQSLSVLLRGETPRHNVLLLGGPNRFFAWLRRSWRERIRELWEERGCEFPRERPLEELILAPPNAVLYAAYGAVLYGLQRPDEAMGYEGPERLRAFLRSRELSGRRVGTDPPLVSSPAEGEEFRRRYQRPSFSPARFPPGQTIQGCIGLDGGSTSSKAVLVGTDGTLLAKEYRISEGHPLQDAQEMLSRLQGYATSQGCRLEVLGLGVTGYAADLLEKAFGAGVKLVETVAHMLAAKHYFPDVDVLCDIGGQDIKILVLQNGHVKDFRLSNQCAAGNGMLFQGMARQFGVSLQEYADLAFQADLSAHFSHGCAVFVDADRVNLQREGYSREQLLAGLARVLPKNIWQHVFQVPRLAELGRVFVLQGGTQYNLAAVKAQVDYILERVSDAQVLVHPHAGEAGAFGVALATVEAVRRRGGVQPLDLSAAVALEHHTYQDASTRCGFCSNHCPRTFVDIDRDGDRSRFIAGAGCEDGMADSVEAVRELRQRRRRQSEECPNLVAWETARLFSPAYDPASLPEDGRSGTGGGRQGTAEAHAGGTARRAFRRSVPEAAARRRGIVIGMPRVLGFYDVAPWLLAYFETLEMPRQNLVFSAPTHEGSWRSGCHYGCVDPCFPAKLAHTHVYELLTRPDAGAPLDYLFFPCITHLPTWLSPVVDAAACPVTAGIPKVVRASLIKDRDLFAARGVEYVDDVIQFSEPHYLQKQMFEIWGPRLGITRDESDFACQEGWRALEQFEQEAQRRGREVLEAITRRGGLAVLALCRPYHHDPGVHHGAFDQIQSLGYPVLTIRCLPRDAASLQAVFGADVAAHTIAGPADLRDVWPENYSSHSGEKVWAAKYAARHPHLAVLDLSSFKCGNDAPTYAVIDNIIKSKRVPYAMLHDIDANRSAGSMKLRLRTFAYLLDRSCELLAPGPGDALTLPEPPVAECEPALAEPVACLPALAASEPVGGAGLADRGGSLWRIPQPLPFTADQRAGTTILLGGLTAAHDSLIEAGWRAMGYRVHALPQADTEAFRYGKEFGSRGQCNPAYFTVGNLLKFLHQLRDVEGLSTERIVRDYVFLTAGACGPCRFGVYAAEYRKSLHDAGFEGFRVLLFQQVSLSQCSGPHTGLEMRFGFFLQLIRTLMAGDVLNVLGYRLRPYEVTPGATDEALARSREICYEALLRRQSLPAALRRCRRLLQAVEVDRLVPRPKVEVTGEFWALTTEGDGNYRLQRFLESEGAEVVVTPVTAWLLYLLWQHRYDTLRRIDLPEGDSGRRGLLGKQPLRRLVRLGLSAFALRRWFGSYCRAIGLRGYRLPDMDKLAALSREFYPPELRGGEGHLEVGRLIQAAQQQRAHLVVSVKPFGCLPSSCVSDGVQSLVTRRYPQMLFCSVETTGDATANAHSRVQMMLFRARQQAEEELATQVRTTGAGIEDVRSYIEGNRRLRDSLHAAPPRFAGTATSVFREAADGMRRKWW